MNTSLAERYAHYDIGTASEWQSLQPSDAAKCAESLGKYASHLADAYTIAPGDQLEFSEDETKLISQAKAFVEQATGLPVTCDVAKFTELYDNRDGVYDSSLHQIAVYKHATGTEYGDDISFGGLLVHEFTHSTSVYAAKILDLEKSGRHGIYTLQPHHVSEVTPSFCNDNFFEEGLAEEIASRWREQFDPRLQGRDRDLFASRGLSPIPVRMYHPSAPIDETTHDLQRGYNYPAYCAFGIQLLSEYTGVDLIDLLVQARHPKSQTQASRLLKETVESVEPGLYDVLTAADYTIQDFEDCVAIIKQAIANHAHEQAA